MDHHHNQNHTTPFNYITPGWLEIRLFYVRITPCSITTVPENLTLRNLRREIGVSLEINGVRVPSTETVLVNLRRDRLDKTSSEVTYVSTDNVRLTGPIEFEVINNNNIDKKVLCNNGSVSDCNGGGDDKDMILCGSLERIESGGGWSMEFYAGNMGVFGSSSIEVYIAGCCGSVPVILTKTITHTGEEADEYAPELKVGPSYHSDEMYYDEDGQLTWFNAGVRVGVGIGLGMCLGIGIGVGLLMRQTTRQSIMRIASDVVYLTFMEDNAWGFAGKVVFVDRFRFCRACSQHPLSSSAPSGQYGMWKFSGLVLGIAGRSASSTRSLELKISVLYYDVRESMSFTLSSFGLIHPLFQNPDHKRCLMGFDCVSSDTGGVNPVMFLEDMDSNSNSNVKKRVRKPYTITKSRQNWTDIEHDKFLEALQLFDRDWKKIEAFVGSKTAIQIRSHAQKYFLKVQKTGTNEHVPPPRPKRKAAHPYPLKAKNDVTNVGATPQSSSDLIKHENTMPTDSYMWPIAQPDVGAQDDAILHNSCSSSIDSGPGVWQAGETNNHQKVKHTMAGRVMPDFPNVYRFIGGVFDPNESNHLQKLKMMDPVDVETV
ncbi:Homeodomain-like protein [Artemisia annua]|nr:Homeodomain-like protein [Artemisia annua]